MRNAQGKFRLRVDGFTGVERAVLPTFIGHRGGKALQLAQHRIPLGWNRGVKGVVTDYGATSETTRGLRISDIRSGTGLRSSRG